MYIARYVYTISSKVGRSIAKILDPRQHFVPRSDIEAIDQPTMLYNILYSTVSMQQMSLLPENTSQNDAISSKSQYG